MVKLDNQYLISQYQSTGDSRILEEIIENNMGLIVTIAKRYSYTSILDIDDHIQSGRIAVVKAVKSFDLTKGTKFSDYVGKAIEREIRNYINSCEPSIRIPDHMVLKCRRYIKCVRELEIKLRRNPTSEEISEEMELSLDDVIKIESALSTQNYTSLDAQVSPEVGTNTLSNTTKVSEGDFQSKIDDRISNVKMFALLRTILNPIEYYIYWRFAFFNDRGLQTQMAEELKITKNNISSRLKRISFVIGNYFTDDGMPTSLAEQLFEQYRTSKISLFNLRVDPVTPAAIFIYFYIKDDLSMQEKRLLYFRLFGSLKPSKATAAKELQCTEAEVQKIALSIKTKICNKFRDKDNYLEFRRLMLEKLQARIFLLILNPTYDFSFWVDNGELMCRMYINPYESVSMNSLRTSASACDVDVSNYTVSISKDDVERDVYLAIFGYKKRKMIRKNANLETTFLNERSLFTEEEILFLEAAIFCRGDDSKQRFERLYPQSNLPENHGYLIKKLEMLDYGIDYCYFTTRDCFDKLFRQFQTLGIVDVNDCEMVLPDDLLFFGNIDAILHFWRLVVHNKRGDRENYSSIKTTIEKQYGINDIEYLVRVFILSVYRLQRGVSRKNNFTYEDVIDYVSECCIGSSQSVLEKYLDVNGVYDPDLLDNTIIFKMLKKLYPEHFNLDTVSKEEVSSILAKHGSELDPRVQNYLLTRFRLGCDNIVPIDRCTKILDRMAAAFAGSRRS